MCGFHRVRRGTYFGGELIGRAEVDVRVGKLKNGKAADKDEITQEMIKDGGDRMVDWIWKLCNMAFDGVVMPEDWSSAVIVSLYKVKGERTECKNYRSISLLSVVGKIYAGLARPRVVAVRRDALDTGREGTRVLGSGGAMVGPEWGPEAGWTSMGIVGSPAARRSREEIPRTKTT